MTATNESLHNRLKISKSRKEIVAIIKEIHSFAVEKNQFLFDSEFAHIAEEILARFDYAFVGKVTFWYSFKLYVSFAS